MAQLLPGLGGVRSIQITGARQLEHLLFLRGLSGSFLRILFGLFLGKLKCRHGVLLNELSHALQPRQAMSMHAGISNALMCT